MANFGCHHFQVRILEQIISQHNFNSIWKFLWKMKARGKPDKSNSYELSDKNKKSTVIRPCMCNDSHIVLFRESAFLLSGWALCFLPEGYCIIPWEKSIFLPVHSLRAWVCYSWEHEWSIYSTHDMQCEGLGQLHHRIDILLSQCFIDGFVSQTFASHIFKNLSA